MGSLSSEELFISPLASVVLFILVLLSLEYGSRFFLRMQEPPSLEWKVLSLFRGDLFNVSGRLAELPDVHGLRGVRSLYAMSREGDPVLQSKAASALAALTHVVCVDSSTPPPAQLRALATLTRRFTAPARGMAALGLGLDPALRQI